MDIKALLAKMALPGILVFPDYRVCRVPLGHLAKLGHPEARARVVDRRCICRVPVGPPARLGHLQARARGVDRHRMLPCSFPPMAAPVAAQRPATH
mmetsp:Transcript_4348/g.10804  ORF Transcript_4348/g.10804 Transcript_4348/m.10804 type:complete len:96 (-) Transcript_4348:135-422(-)